MHRGMRRSKDEHLSFEFIDSPKARNAMINDMKSINHLGLCINFHTHVQCGEKESENVRTRVGGNRNVQQKENLKQKTDLYESGNMNE